MIEHPKRLHLGCGKVYLPDWTNVDVFQTTLADEYCDVRALPFNKGTFDLIYASHILEHVQRNMVLATLTHWRSLLRTGGTLRLAVPNFEAVAEHYVEHRNLGMLMGLLYGGQNHYLNKHTTTFDRPTLTASLEAVGFREVRAWDWRHTEHSQYDDFSQCYLPHMVKDDPKSRLMSLNLEAIAP